MSILVCPNCGSRYLLVARDDRNSACTITEQGQIELDVPSPAYAGVSGVYELNHVFCGACSWHGLPAELSKSDLY